MDYNREENLQIIIFTFVTDFSQSAISNLLSKSISENKERETKFSFSFQHYIPFYLDTSFILRSLFFILSFTFSVCLGKGFGVNTLIKDTFF